MSNSVGLALKLKVSLYTGLAEPSTAEVLLHLTNLLWFIRDTLTNTPEGQSRLWGGWGGGACPPGCQDPITQSRCSQRAFSEEMGLISAPP